MHEAHERPYLREEELQALAVRREIHQLAARAAFHRFIIDHEMVAARSPRRV
jgi:hypothetical protein